MAFIFITLTGQGVTDQSPFPYVFMRAAEGFVSVMTFLIAAGKKLGLSVGFIEIILLHSVAAELYSLKSLTAASSQTTVGICLAHTPPIQPSPCTKQFPLL